MIFYTASDLNGRDSPVLGSHQDHASVLFNSESKPQPRHWNLDHKATQKAISKGLQNLEQLWCCSLAGAKAHQYQPIPATRKGSQRKSLSSQTLCCKFIYFAGAFPFHTHRATLVHLLILWLCGSRRLQWQPAQADTAWEVPAPVSDSWTVSELRCCISNYH